MAGRNGRQKAERRPAGAWRRRVAGLAAAWLGAAAGWLAVTAAFVRAGPAPPVSGASLAARMDEAMAWPSRFSSLVEVSRPSGERPVRVELVGFPPDLFGWEVQEGAQDPRGAVAWNGLVEWRRQGPGPRFSYSYSGIPFLEALRVYLAVFRPLPAGSRLSVSGGVTVAGRAAVEVLLQEAGGREAVLAVDPASGLILRAVTTLPERRTVVAALPPAARSGGTAQRMEYEVPPLGPQGRLVVERVAGRWFVTEAVAGDPPHRVRFGRLRFGSEVSASPPDKSRLEQLAQRRQQGQALIARRQYRQAMELYGELVAVDPYSVEAYNQLGLAAMNVGDWLVAASAFHQVIHLAPRSPVGYNNLAYLYARHQLNLTQALALAERAMELTGGRPDPTVLDTYGWVLVHNGRPQEAVRVLEQALSLSLQDPQAQAEILYHLGVAHWKLSRREEARRLLSRALELQPELAEARQALGQLTGPEGGGGP
ncbi:MAG TPA: tetratricopeptide repeat protein [Limnochordales bacterium]